jgi:hypothetical protein
MNNPMELCPKFDWCNAPKCPLDPDVNARVYRPEFKESKCRLEKKELIKIQEKIKGGK